MYEPGTIVQLTRPVADLPAGLPGRVTSAYAISLCWPGDSGFNGDPSQIARPGALYHVEMSGRDCVFLEGANKPALAATDPAALLVRLNVYAARARTRRERFHAAHLLIDALRTTLAAKDAEITALKTANTGALAEIGKLSRDYETQNRMYQKSEETCTALREGNEELRKLLDDAGATEQRGLLAKLRWLITDRNHWKAQAMAAKISGMDAVQQGLRAVAQEAPADVQAAAAADCEGVMTRPLSLPTRPEGKAG